LASLVLLRNPLAPESRELHAVDAGTPVIDWLQEHHPHGFGMPIRFYLNGEEQALDDLDRPIGDDDVAVIALMPADPTGGFLTAIAINLAIAAVLSAASFAINYFFFQPKERSGPKGGPVSVYNISGDQNAARIGDAIPVVYGTVLTTPDYVAQPFTTYEWYPGGYDAYYSGVQFLYMLLCVGQGNIDVTNVYLGDTSSATPDAGIVTWRAFKPADHRKIMGPMTSAMGYPALENVITSPEVSNQEFVNPGDTAGFFATCKPGQKGANFELDFVWPGGLFDPDENGAIRGRSVQFRVYWMEMDDNDNLVGSYTEKTITVATGSSDVVTAKWQGSGTWVNTSESAKNKTVLISPIRRTYQISTGRSARWAVKVTRVTGAPNAKNGTDRFIWTGLKLYADPAPGTVYGDVTLLAVKVKASQGIGSDASVRIRCKATRRLPQPGGGAEAQSTNGADAFADVYTNTVYGAGRPRSELELSSVNLSRSRWAGYQFNHVFRDRITVWEALSTITTPFAAEPVPFGPQMGIVRDGVKSTRSMLFTDANIISGSLSIGYSWDEEGARDGIEIEYLDPKDFRQQYAKYPSTSLQPEKFTLPGCTSYAHALEYAYLIWQKRQFQRKRVTFDTELEGLLLQLGDRIGVSHNVPKWGEGGLVIGVSGNTLTVDHDLNWSGGAKQILLRAADGSVSNAITVTRGSGDHKVVLPSSPPFTIHADDEYDYTSFAFGSSTSLVRDFIVTSVTPSSDTTVTVEAVNYVPDIYTGAMSFLQYG